MYSFFTNIINSIISYFVIYIKLIQWLNVERQGYFNKKIFNYLKKFVNNVPYVSSDINYTALNLLNFEIDKIPINSGTISLVFIGIISDKKVAIKMKRNNIAQKVKNILNNLKFISKFVFFYPMTDMIFNIQQIFFDQTNFEQEKNNIIYFNENINHNLIHNLEIIENLSNTDLIVMKFIEGKTIYELTEEEKEKCLILFVKTSFYLLYIKKILHMDCHPGNLLFIKNEDTFKISYIDLGIMMIIEDMKDIDLIFMFSKYITNLDLSDIILYIKNNKDKMYTVYQDYQINSLCEKIKECKLFTNKNISKLSEDLKYFIFLNNKIGLKITKFIYNYLLHLLSVFSVVLYLDTKDQYFDILSKSFNNFD